MYIFFFFKKKSRKIHSIGFLFKSLAGSYVQVRIKAMLNIDIYRKTLRRMDTVTSADNNENDEDKKDDDNDDKKDKDKKDEEKEDVSSNTGTIVNLMSTDSNRISQFSTWWFSIIAGKN